MDTDKCRAENDAIAALVNQCVVPPFKEGNDRPCNPEDFDHFKTASVESLEELLLILTNRNNCKAGLCVKEIVTPLLLLFGENSQRFPWNNEESYEICQKIRRLLLGGLGYSEVVLLVSC